MSDWSQPPPAQPGGWYGNASGYSLDFGDQSYGAPDPGYASPAPGYANAPAADYAQTMNYHQVGRGPVPIE